MNPLSSPLLTDVYQFTMLLKAFATARRERPVAGGGAARPEKRGQNARR